MIILTDNNTNTVFTYFRNIAVNTVTVSSTNIGTLDKYEQRQLWK